MPHLEDMPDLSERLGSDIWWKLKTGWTDAKYLSRKNALITRIREKWPEVNRTVKPDQIIDGIESLVITFNDSDWCLPEEPDRNLVFAEQLRIYAKWAQSLRWNRELISSNEPYTMPASNTNLRIPLLARSKPDVVAPRSRPTEIGQGAVALGAPVFDAVAAGAIPSVNMKELFNWDDVEMYIDLKIYSLRSYTIPMTILKSGDPGTPCHWYDFSFRRFQEVLKYETGGNYSDEYSYSIFWMEERQWARIEGPGSYATMLKRFSEEAKAKSSLNLFICSGIRGYPAETDVPGGESYAATPRSLKRKASSE